MTDTQRILSADEIASAAKRIYQEKFRGQYEGAHDGEFLAIDVVTQDAYFGKYPENALEEAKRAVPDGTIYLVRIGEPAAFNVGYTSEKSNVDRPIRRYAHRDPGLQPA